MSGRGLRVVLAGGGTGGHVIPALAVAGEIVRRGGEARFVGTRGRLEERLVPAAGFGIDFIEVRPLSGVGLTGAALGAAFVPVALARSAALLHRIRPDAVLGVGGYVAGPVVLAASLTGIPAAVLEQNAAVGLTNRLLRRFVRRAFVSYEETVAEFPRGRAELTGNPVGRPILDAAAARSGDEVRERVSIVVMGGSQGARAIDERVPAAMAEAGLGKGVSVLHQAGVGREEEVRAAYAAAGIEARVVTFIDDTAGAYRGADLVVARAGATTVAELTVMGLPAVLLPYPHHADRQQHRNAEPMRRAGAAVVLDELETGVAELAAAISELAKDGVRRAAAAAAALALGHPDAATRIVDGLERLAGGRA
ncbi:MAG: undecaprenyldiphospho-muramoylpentapeptide beta-N-acetylglucosaminyltransferase [Deltaproteobacteria bacterium]|nr:undecaprenyldiphospho-muramoylpentapeptide beta-N-acetylglucosaminyltransferase [Deltaproteobacteria bacterium]